MLGALLKRVLADPRTGAAAVRTAAAASAHEPSQAEEARTDSQVFTIDWGLHGLLGLLTEYRFQTVLDIGSGRGEHARLLRHFGKQVFSVDLHRDADYVGDFLDVAVDRRFDVVWCSHVLEHQRNVGRFLDKLFECLDEGGILAISVPCHPRSRLIAGHVTTWNAGLLCYNLVLAGFDCSEARFVQTGDLSLIVRKKRAVGRDIGGVAASGLDLTGADALEALADFFPFPVETGGEAELLQCNWVATPYALRVPRGSPPIKILGRMLPPEGLTIGAD